jgi:beta-lactamase class A
VEHLGWIVPGSSEVARLSAVTHRLCACLAALSLSVVVQAELVPSHAPASTAAMGSKGKSTRWGARLSRAAGYARGRLGSVSFALVDERGRIHGSNRGARYSSASLVKAMLLVAYLNHGGVRGRRLRAADRRLLGPMIRVSDNHAADAVYERVGVGGLARLARRAGMRRFEPNTAWGGCQVTARDQARFFSRIAPLTPRRHRRYALGLLRRIVAIQRWGIPRAIPRGWRVYFKGGWFKDPEGWRALQAALLQQGRRRLAIAVLTAGSPSLGYGAATIQGVTERLLAGYKVAAAQHQVFGHPH